MPVDKETVLIFGLAKRLSVVGAEMLEEAGIERTSDLVSLFGTCMAMAQSYGVAQGGDLENTIQSGAKLVESVTRALVTGDRSKFDA